MKLLLYGWNLVLSVVVLVLLFRGGGSGPKAVHAPSIPPAPYLLTQLRSRSVSPGNPTGAKGGAYQGKLHGKGEQPGEQYTKHTIKIPSGTSATLADIEGPGTIRSIWLTFPNRVPETLRSYIVRIYWDGADYPSVEAPIGDFFGLLHGRTAHYATPYLGASEGKGFYCFFPMPFLTRCRIVIENDSPKSGATVFYQVIYTLGDDITPEMGRFHAHFRRATPPRGTNYLLLDTQGSPGVYVGAVISALPREGGTWREGDIRFFIDGDKDRATIVGTGWSDWFLSGWGLGVHQSLYAGSNYQVVHPEYQERYFATCYRFHAMDPIYFQKDLRVEYTQIGQHRGSSGNDFGERSDDWCSTVYWYQHLTGKPLPRMPSRAERIAGIQKTEWEEAAWKRMLSGADRRSDSH